MLNGPGTAATAQGGSAPGNTTASNLALLSKSSKNGKPAGRKGLPSALEKTLPKGKGSFFSLLSAMAATKDAARNSAASLKTLALKAAEAEPGKSLVLEGLSQNAADSQAPAANQEAPKEEKGPGKKKAGHLQAVTVAALSVQALTLSDGPRAHAPKEKPSSGDSALGAKVAATGARHVSPTREPTVHIVDLRARSRHASSEEAAAAKVTVQPSTSDRDGGAALAQKPGQNRDSAPQLSDRAPAAAPASAQTPLERLRDMAGSELLKATNLVLKDGGGEIRLVLKPESLGSVRIRMNVVDNNIEGRIIVDSSSVKQVFDANIDALRRALTAEGFQTGSLQVSVGGQNTDADARREQQPSEAVRRMTAQGFERNVPGVETMSLGDLLVNLFV